MLEDGTIRQTIRSLIDRKEKRIGEIHKSTQTELRAYHRMLNEHTIECIQHGIDSLIELEHNLKLCGCPEEAYQQQEEQACPLKQS